MRHSRRPAVPPLLLVVAIVIKARDRGPVFFRQERVGLAGKTFRVWKFRSMTQGADKKIGEATASRDQQNNVFYKSASDARVTPFGRFIRRTSIDEVPQLFNVLAGQMSIVGPRPLVRGRAPRSVTSWNAGCWCDPASPGCGRCPVAPT